MAFVANVLDDSFSREFGIKEHWPSCFCSYIRKHLSLCPHCLFSCHRILNWGKSTPQLLKTCFWKKRKGKDVTCGQVWWPIPGKCTHTQQWVVNKHAHTDREHTPGAVGSQCYGARGAVGGLIKVGGIALLKGLTSIVVLRVEKALDIHSPHLQSLPELRLEPVPFPTFKIITK